MNDNWVRYVKETDALKAFPLACPIHHFLRLLHFLLLLLLLLTLHKSYQRAQTIPHPHLQPQPILQTPLPNSIERRHNPDTIL